MKDLLHKIMPPGQWRLPVIILLEFSQVWAYMFLLSPMRLLTCRTNRKTCINCHVMNPQYASWNTVPTGKLPIATIVTFRITTLLTIFLQSKGWYAACHHVHLRMEPQVIRIKDAGTTRSAGIVSGVTVRCSKILCCRQMFIPIIILPGRNVPAGIAIGKLHMEGSTACQPLRMPGCRACRIPFLNGWRRS
jgi:hypothetical protein